MKDIPCDKILSNELEVAANDNNFLSKNSNSEEHDAILENNETEAHVEHFQNYDSVVNQIDSEINHLISLKKQVSDFKQRMGKTNERTNRKTKKPSQESGLDLMSLINSQNKNISEESIPNDETVSPMEMVKQALMKSQGNKHNMKKKHNEEKSQLNINNLDMNTISQLLSKLNLSKQSKNKPIKNEIENEITSKPNPQKIDINLLNDLNLNNDSPKQKKNEELNLKNNLKDNEGLEQGMESFLKENKSTQNNEIAKLSKKSKPQETPQQKQKTTNPKVKGKEHTQKKEEEEGVNMSLDEIESQLSLLKNLSTNSNPEP
jgi:hypothetical protein